jgi:hypothetical protein
VNGLSNHSPIHHLSPLQWMVWGITLRYITCRQYSEQLNWSLSDIPRVTTQRTVLLSYEISSKLSCLMNSCSAYAVLSLSHLSTQQFHDVEMSTRLITLLFHNTHLCSDPWSSWRVSPINIHLSDALLINRAQLNFQLPTQTTAWIVTPLSNISHHAGGQVYHLCTCHHSDMSG